MFAKNTFRYITNSSILALSFNAAEKIEWLEISHTGNICGKALVLLRAFKSLIPGEVTDGGIKHLANFPNLKYVRLENLPGVRRPEEALKYLEEHLPNCEVDYADLKKDEETDE